MTRALRLLMVVLAAGGVVIGAVGGVGPARADSSLLKPFFGSYVGESLMPSVEMLPRDLRVSIRPAGEDGFVVEWQTTLFKFGESQRRNAQFLQFRRNADGPPMYRAVPPDAAAAAASEASESALEGGSFAWAHVQGNAMRVHILTFLDDGGYVLQSYDRTLTRGGMSLSFARVRDGTVEQRLRAELRRVDG
jgi:hypothetical protein